VPSGGLVKNAERTVPAGGLGGSTGVGTQEILEGLDDLLQLDYDAAAAYEVAIERLQDRDYASQIAGFRLDHQRHIRQLRELIADLGGTVRTPPRAAGPFEVALRSLGSLAGDRARLIAFRMNELQVRARYDAYAARANAWPPHIKRVIDMGALDEERHYRWVTEVLGQEEPRDEEQYSGLEFAGQPTDRQAGAADARDLLGQVRDRPGEGRGLARGEADISRRLDELRDRADQLMDEAAERLESVAARVDETYADSEDEGRRAREQMEQTRARMSSTVDAIEAALAQKRSMVERVPDMPDAAAAPAADLHEWMEEEARRVLRDHRVLSAPVDPLRLAWASGVGVHHAAFVDAALVSTVSRRGARGSILVQRAVPAEVRRLAIAHALGHYVLHLGDDGDFVDREVDLYRWTGPSGQVVHVRIRDELEANLFSHALLMPQDQIARAMQRHPGAPVPELAAFFQVPHWLMGFRLAQLGY
jgi:rubrerythrin